MTLSLNDKFILAIGLASLIFYILKLLFLVLGGDHSDSLNDFSSDLGDSDAQMSFSLFSTQSLLAFLMGSSWSFLAARHEWHYKVAAAWFVAVSLGFFMMSLSAYLLSKIKLLNSTSEFDLGKAKGKTGLVYLTVPPRGEGLGQVELVVDGRKKILKAMTLSSQKIKSFARVEVVQVENNILIVKSL